MRGTQATRALENKLSRDRATVLTASEVRILARQVRRLVEPSLGQSPFATTRVEDGVRWASLRARCQQARAERGLGIRHVAIRLQLPQYRLKAIENGQLTEFRSEVARRYFRFLEIEAWIARWCRANPGLALRIGLRRTPGRDDQQKRTRRHAV